MDLFDMPWAASPVIEPATPDEVADGQALLDAQVQIGGGGDE